jgi:hypothetical protein
VPLSAHLCLCACGGRILTLRGACECGHVVIVWVTITLTLHCCNRFRPLWSSQPPPARLKARAHPHHTDRVTDGGYCSICLCVYMGSCVCPLLLLPLAMHAHVRVCVCAGLPVPQAHAAHAYWDMCMHHQCVCVCRVRCVCAYIACLTRPEAFHRLCVTDHDPCFSLSVGHSRPA